MKYKMHSAVTGLALFIITMLCSCVKTEPLYEDKGYVYFTAKATFDQMQPAPVNSSVGTASFFARYDNNSRIFNYSVSWKDMSTPVTRADFYFPSNTVQNGWLQRNMFNTTTPRPVADSATGYIWSNTALSDQELADLKAGKVYFLIVTQANTAGEIRGYVQPQ